ncbi:MAG: hypothetical protein HY707_10045 [Ignavibacteriae bacterium]|nr:hypothetical protein [Ignavibacteriota bacterium]
MARKRDLSAFVFHIHSAETIGFTALATEAYLGLLRYIDTSIASKLILQKPKELTLSSEIMHLVRAFVRALSLKKKVKCYILLIEMLQKDVDVHAYDDVCEAVELAIRDKRTSHPWFIGIAVGHQDVFRTSVLLRDRLIPRCKKNDVGLILLSDDQSAKPLVLCQGKLPQLGDLPTLQPPVLVTQPGESGEVLTADQIAAEFQILFGHFEVELKGKAYHLPAIASTKKLAKNMIFLQQLRNDISRKLGNTTFSIYPFGIPGGGLNELSSALVKGNTERILDETKIEKHDGSAMIILCDFLAPTYPLEEVIRKARIKRTHELAIGGIASYQNRPNIEGIESFTYLETNYEAISVDNLSNCKFCQQHIAPIKGDHFDIFARGIKQFDTFTFWEFIAQRDEFFSAGHWKSPITPNHYLFLIKADPIFRRHGYDLSLRLRNILDSKNIRPWIKKIVCTEAEASTNLSKELCEVLGLQQKDVIQIPRRFFSTIAGKQLDTDLQTYINSQHGIDNLKRQNVIIVDQAAHHFKTMSSLRYICEFFECTVLAFAVFVDRTDVAFSLGEYLHDSHYIALYSWPVPPRRVHECQCK